MRENLTFFSGTAGAALAERTAELTGRMLGRCTVERFPDGEVNVRLEEPVRGCAGIETSEC